jgi:hypothetical protein
MGERAAEEVLRQQGATKKTIEELEKQLGI